MTDAEVLFCVGSQPGYPCGLYAIAATTARKGWRVDGYNPVRYVCPKCWEARQLARVRAALRNGVKLDPSNMSPTERKAAKEVLGEGLLATIDAGWSEHRRNTPLLGTPMPDDGGVE